MSPWIITLAGEESEIKFIESLLAGSPQAMLLVDGEHLLPLIDVPSSVEIEVANAKAQDLLDSLNGAARLLRIVFRGLSIVRVLRTNEDGGRTGSIHLEAVHLPQRDFEILPEDGILREWLQLAEVDSEAARALYLFGSLPQNWKNLYMVYEVIEQDFGGESGLMRARISDNQQLKIFKQTSNSYFALGRDARHARNRELPPAKPMTLAEAREFVTTLMKTWLAGKINLPNTACTD